MPMKRSDDFILEQMETAPILGTSSQRRTVISTRPGIALGMGLLVTVGLLCAVTVVTSSNSAGSHAAAGPLQGQLGSTVGGQVQADSENDLEELEHLFLTPYIESGRVQEGRELARVRRMHSEKVKSFSGYLTINEEYQSNLFFWFFPAEKNHEKAPVMIWLEGGPGENGFFGAFVQHGPFKVNKNLKLEKRKTSWTKMFNMIYIDQPVGSGFSFTRDERGYATNVTQSTTDLFHALTQFFTLFPMYKDNDFYVAGISFGGKCSAALSQRILHENKAGANINFKGIVIASGFVDPIAMVDKGDFYYQVNFIDKNTRDWGRQQYAMVLEEYKKGNLSAAAMIARQMSDRFMEVAGYDKTADFLPLEKAPGDYFYYEEFVQLKHARRSLHAGNETFKTFYGAAQAVGEYMSRDLVSGIQNLMEEILNSSLPILIYHGNMDITFVHTHLPYFLKQLNWPGVQKFRDAVPSVWRVDGANAGHVTFADNLTYVVVRNSGHIVVHDQPKWSYEMMNRYLNKLPWT